MSGIILNKRYLEIAKDYKDICSSSKYTGKNPTGSGRLSRFLKSTQLQVNQRP